MKHLPYLVTAIWISGFLGGCASTKERVFEEHEMKTMRQIYDDKFGSVKSIDESVKKRIIQNDRGDLSGYTRTAESEVSVLFPLLPNPRLVMYIYPHLTDANLPVPGYVTSFFMYKHPEYAMPGELKEKQL